MDVREKLVELIAQKVCDTWSESCDQWLPHDCGKCYANDCNISELADHLIANGVTVQGSKVVEIGQFKLPIADAILILKEEHKQRADGYATHLSYGGKGDPAEEAHLDALEMAIAALEWQNRTLPEPPKGE